MNKKTLRFRKCKEVPAPFWLFTLEETKFRDKDEDPGEVSQLIETQKKVRRSQIFL